VSHNAASEFLFGWKGMNFVEHEVVFGGEKERLKRETNFPKDMGFGNNKAGKNPRK